MRVICCSSSLWLTEPAFLLRIWYLRTFQKPILSLVLVLSILFMRPASGWLSLVVFLHAGCCRYSDAKKIWNIPSPRIRNQSVLTRRGDYRLAQPLTWWTRNLWLWLPFSIEWLPATVHEVILSRLFKTKFPLFDFLSRFQSC